ncbi:exosortase F system-associated protein [Flavobacterium sp. Sd200]|uniref:exosortase F system-associated membrane protein n=1 Tax=Flavobacterium sp. Sd200 TaxID=2692211 RepID=UPI00136CCC63|nr:exosortase F system-associated protein [Flavobacterium sp. Sd200]MXN91008.1 exosortase F system-associated protein [Flavobacterium sp. Sd200]
MQQKFKLSTAGALTLVVLLVLLVCIRIFQTALFYDPLLIFFESSKKYQLPDYDAPLLYLNLAFRYMLNSLITLAVLWVVFKDKAILKLSALLLLVFFAVLIAALYVALSIEEPGLLIIFYIRRFLIQPLFLILFLPAFYYQKYLTK